MKSIKNSNKWEFSRAPGFTLLEVMVAIAVLAVVLVAVLRMQGQTIAMNEVFRFYTLAPQLAMDKMAEVELSPESFQTGGSGDFGEDLSGYQWKAEVEEVVLTTDADREMHLQQVDITVAYMDDEFVYTAREYLPAPEAGL
jgi:general secretion pathway protein I